MPLTDIKVKTAKPMEKAYKLADGGGMYLLVKPNGSKYWRLKYRFAGKEKMLSIGVYPDVSLADAREKRKEARKTLASGGDPGEVKKAEKLSQKLLVFIGRNDRTKPISKESVNQVIELLGYKRRLTGHGFRHTMSTILHEKGYNSAWIETQLAHVDKNAIRGAYNHAQYLDGRREMMQWYADNLESMLDSEILPRRSFSKSA
jgi:Arm DNA-binding domain/Phage integrase family